MTGRDILAARPRLKEVVWRREGDHLRVVYDIRDFFVLADPEGTVEALLELLAEGGRTPEQLADALAGKGRKVTLAELADVLEALDSHRLLEDESRLGRFSETEQERYLSNLGFFESFASLATSREDFQSRLRESHVLVLGTGGLNSNTIPHLCGLGVGRLTLLDQDAVDLRNFARQYLYRHRDIGSRKVAVAAEWVRQFDPAIKVDAIDASVSGPDQLGQLIDDVKPDVVMSGVDSPNQVDDWVNTACVTRAVPYVRGGMWVTQGLVWSVDPGRSACRRCAQAAGATADQQTEAELAQMAMFASKPRLNRGIGPVAGLLGALCAFEVLRYLTEFEPPAYAGRMLAIDFANGCATEFLPGIERSPTCTVCGHLG